MRGLGPRRSYEGMVKKLTPPGARNASPAKRPRATISARAEDPERARDVVLERIESQMQMVLEAVASLSEQMRSQLSELETKLSDRITVLEQVVRQNSADIRQNSADIRQNSADIKQNSADIKRNSADIKTLREEVAQLRRDFDRRAEIARVTELEGRLARVEAKLGIAS